MVLMADTLSSRSRKNNIIVTTHPPDSYREEQSLAEMRGFFVGKLFPFGTYPRSGQIPLGQLTFEFYILDFLLITLLIDKKHDFRHFLSIRGVNHYKS